MTLDERLAKVNALLYRYMNGELTPEETEEQILQTLTPAEPLYDMDGGFYFPPDGD